MKKIKEYLTGGDLRSIAKVDQLLTLIISQHDFDQLFQYLFSEDRLLVMRAADAVEKVTVKRPEFLAKHKKEIIDLLRIANDKELKWHMALIVPRLDLLHIELVGVWDVLSKWVKNKSESRIVRVNSLQSLFDLENKYEGMKVGFQHILERLGSENIPSINARLKKLGIK